MAMLRFAVLLSLLFSTVSLSYAQCDTGIPGHYPGRFTDNGDGTITDNMTGLMWSKCIMGMYWSSSQQTCTGPASDTQEEVRVDSLDWQSTLQKVVEINNSGGYAGRTDWRLPNIKELGSLLEPACLDDGNNIALDKTYFNIRSLSTEFSEAVEFWSSTPHRRVQVDEATGKVTNQAWKMGMRFGGEFGARPAAITSQAYARLVRGDQ